MTTDASPPDVVVLGAGLSGLLAARVVQARGCRVRVLEKARGVGGRLATRRVEEHVADHGAQFFTAHDPQFRGLVEEWVAAGVARQWSTGFALPDGTFRDNGVPRYCGVGGMTAIPKYLARDLDVRLESKVVGVTAEDGGWRVTTEGGEAHTGRALLLTAPLPQCRELLGRSGIRLSPGVQEVLDQTDYASCFSVLARLAGPSRVPEPGGLWMPGEPLLWVADNRRKGVSSAAGTLVTIHAGPEFTREHWGASDEEVIARMLAEAEPWLGAAVEQAQVHRWRYSVPLRVHPEPCLLVTEPGLLAFAGDVFGGPRVEAAALSGLAAGAALGERFSHSR